MAYMSEMPTIKFTLVEDHSCHNGWRIVAGGDGVPASIYEVAMWSRIKELEDENRKLRRLQKRSAKVKEVG